MRARHQFLEAEVQATDLLGFTQEVPFSLAKLPGLEANPSENTKVLPQHLEAVRQLI